MAVKVSKKATSIKRVVRTRFKREVRELKQLCEDMSLSLMDYASAQCTDICVLSEDEYEIGSTKSKCNESVQNYFLSEEEYYKYQSSDS